MVLEENLYALEMKYQGSIVFVPLAHSCACFADSISQRIGKLLGSHKSHEQQLRAAMEAPELRLGKEAQKHVQSHTYWRSST